MVKVYICSDCKSNKCSSKKGIEIYEILRQYTYLVDEVELIMSKCMCQEGCAGYKIQIDEEIYTDIDINRIEEILFEHYS
ncbi:NADH:ubiquinone oxidoreductase subunit E [Anaerosolibacter carboniphilus]|uniref:NADH:ubiquinone oxidoreductase subunit E n=1 Tax=Anaerosolibacter carboniphilus TaxID=1417629 RepID=A0A841KTT9_9FIRM|nr:hypothetical protein [Anaerosolibacter carboniphilus]MBB6215440.1 NADH:ubiquinone oxidoreductase subunit E [Anaerosolibacter carboniphilus]